MYVAYGAPLLAVGDLVGYAHSKKRKVLCLCKFFLLGYFFLSMFSFLFVFFQLNVQEDNMSAFKNPTCRIV